MANALYNKFKQGLLNKENDMDTDAIKATLIDSEAYTFAQTHANYTTDVAAGSKIAVSAALTSPTIVDGVFDTADFSWATVSGVQSEAIILWNDTPTTPTADPLAAFYDTGMSGMPVTPNGGNINVTVHASGWFAL
jgi:hypothetical protein